MNPNLPNLHSARKWFFPLVLLLAGLLLAGCGGISLAQGGEEAGPEVIPTVTGNVGVIAEGRIVPRDSSELGFEAGGKVAQVLVAEDDEVNAGDVLVVMDGRAGREAAVKAAGLERLDAQQALDDLHDQSPVAREQARQEVAAAEEAVIEARQALDDLDTDEFQDELDEAWIAVQDAQDELEDAEEEFDKYEDLDEDNSSRTRAEDELEDARQAYDEAVREYDRLQNRLEQARAGLALAEERLRDAQRDYEARQNGPDPDELALAQSRLDNATAQWEAAQQALDDLELAAPYDATVVDLDVVPEEIVTPGQPLVRIADFSEWYVETSDLTELDVVKIEAGQAVRVAPDALPDVELEGLVESIDRYYGEKAGDTVYTVRIRLREIDPRLRWGMTVQVNFEE